jgi:peptidyl-tRNA hydrolase
MVMKIYIRSDLNMRKGKIAAQASHALTGMLLGSMKKNANEFILTGDNLDIYKNWEKNNYPISIELLNTEESLLNVKNDNNVLIKDQGRTEFNVPTHTCLCELEGIKLEKLIDLEQNQNNPAKQILIANRDLKLTKWELAPIAALSSWLVIEELMIKNENEWILKLNDSALSSWLLGSFAKITLKIEESNIEDMIEKLENNKINYHKIEIEKRPIVLAISPQHFDNIDPLTSNLKLY